ncbi:MAG TPA: hypothetical protein VFA45_05295 [Actinomycetes bacterium]|jgi:hypothetical protein|nr:hypothetical protein [Actinomycetes bacterium]
MRHHRIRRGAAVAVLLGTGLLVALTTPATGAPQRQPSVAAQVPPSTIAPPTTLPAGRVNGRSTTSTTLGTVPVQPPAAPSLFDIPGRIRKAIDDWFQGVVASAVSPAMDLLGRTLLATPGVATGERARELWRISLGLADGAYVLLVTIAGVVLLAHESLQVQYTVKEIAPRLLVGLAAANLSFWLSGQAIELANAGSAALLGQGVDPGHVTATISTLALSPLQAASPLVWLLVGALVVLAVVLAGTCVVRALLVVFLVVAAPLLLAAHAMPQTEGLARLWWRAMAACLGVQLVQALALALAVRVFFEADRGGVLPLGGGHLVDVLVVCCLLWLLIRIPAWAARLVLEGGRRSTLVRLVKGMIVVRTIRGVRDAVGALR